MHQPGPLGCVLLLDYLVAAVRVSRVKLFFKGITGEGSIGLGCVLASIVVPIWAD